MTPIAALPAAYLATRWRQATLTTRARIDAHQARGITALIEDAAGTTAAYRDMRGRALADLPIVDKEVVLSRFEAFNTRGLTAAACFEAIAGGRSDGNVEIGASTGTNGPRGLYVVDAAERFRWLGTIVAKVLPDAPWARHRVAIVLPGPSPLYQAANESRLVTLRHFDATLGADAVRGGVEAFAPTVLLAAPKTLRAFAALRSRMRLRRILSAAEVLDPADRIIVEAWSGLTLGQVYMATEGLFGTSCRFGHLHLAEDVVKFELRPVAGDPTLVTALVTDFTRRTQITARYAMRDLLRIDPGPCACGSAMTRVEVVGREQDMPILRSVGGREVPIAPDRIRDALYGLECDINDYRVAFDEAGRLDVTLPAHVGDATVERARVSLERLVESLSCRPEVTCRAGAIHAPFERKLRRIEGRQ